ncbi:MAG: glycoside hydrolase family 3 N-terminal domain-containing protein [Anaerolineae bacterium]
MRSSIIRALSALLLLSLVIQMVSVSSVSAQEEPEVDPVMQVIDALPTRMKIGQLVLVSFPGTDVGETSALAALLSDYPVGGVLLRPENGNFGPAGDIAATTLLSMTNRLQDATWESMQEEILPPMGINPYQATYIPLFIAVDASVEGVPVSSFISGTTSVPSAMALGGTWTPALAEAAGQIVGRELTAMGVNVYLGPSLDVLDPLHRVDPAGLGISVFGSHAYWVGKMGQAYLRGLHQGSDGQLAVVPKHFPGIGSIDRPLQDEIPTVQRTLEQLQQTDLAAFASVVKGAPGAVSIADGLLVSHVRYSGLQGSIRSSTRPLSLDAQALSTALKRAEAEEWREGQGLLVADNLGMKSLRRFDDPRGLNFNARRIARDALLAGNDLLILDRFTAEGTWEDHFATVRDTLDFLAQSYENDPTFQARVDEALYRLLSLKLRLYPSPLVRNVKRSQESLSEALSVGGTGVNAQVAMSALSRLVPTSEDLLPPTPGEREQFVVFTQENAVPLPERQLPFLAENTVQTTLELLYGSAGTGQVQPGTVQSFTFEELREALQVPTPLPPTEEVTGEAEEEPLPLPYVIRAALERAQWIIFATTDMRASEVGDRTLVEFLQQESEVLEARIVVLDFGAPYGLTSTDYSKIDAYYALYSTGDAFVQAAVRALFRDLPATGAPPVTIPALNYDLSVQTKPDADQIISFSVVKEDGQPMTEDEKNNIYKDDVIYLRTSVIADRNGNPVPDGTPVEFVLTYPEENRKETISVQTKDGVAFTPITLDRVGQLDITVKSDPVAPFYHLQLTIREGQSVVMISVTPRPEEEEPTPTVEPAPRDLPALPEPLRLPTPRRYALLGWAAMGVALASGVGYLWMRERRSEPDLVLRSALWGAIGGLSGYVLLMVGGRGLVPGWLHWLAGREMLTGGVTLVSGMVVNFLHRRWHSERVRG